ncbi:hypothetical protein POPTR_011G010200v4 [Populus trichocarpa]|uniref:Uncharacterized protein n=1 Tax=Populus trichocarpa TaxID=3694 RepID=A0A2K1YE69_POPTR|nr:F-box/LRR-repeat protein At5g63520 [Populus trichocarpa]PNT11323.2 hypothetical protein POPTR_011G010200v4 [Populus trichocarpa]
MEKKPKEARTPILTGFASINEDLVQNILKRTPASSFASAACVCKSWNQTCNQILSKPKLASAFSLNPDQKVASQEVVNKVLSEPIRPQFAIANVIGSGVDLSETLNFLAAKLGSKTPIIVSCANGIIGRDAVTDEHQEVMLEDFWADAASKNSGFGVLLTVGFLPGLQVEAIPLLRPRKAASRMALVDKFVMDIRNYAAYVSGSTSPALVIMFGGEKAEQKPVMEKLDHAMSRETFIAGDERAQFLYKSGIESRNVHGSGNEYISDAVVLVFARDRHRASDVGEIQFHSALSSGVSTIGPRYKVVSVKEIQPETDLTTCLKARREGEQEILGGQRIIDDINNELVNKTELFIGVSKQRQCVIGSENPKLLRSLAFHEVKGGDGEHLFVSGDGIGSGDYFHFYHSDSKAALSATSNVSKNFRNLKLDWSSSQLHAGGVGSKEVVGGLVFSCWGRGESFFGHSNVDSSPFLDNFPGIPMAGIFCYGEVGRGFTMLNADDHEDQEEKTSCCCLHVYSTIYVLVSYTPAPLKH